MIKKGLILILSLGIVFLSGCRGYESKNTAIHPNPNMDWQAKFNAQTLPQLPPEGTFAWGETSHSLKASNRAVYLKANSKYFTGKDDLGRFVVKAPINVTDKMLSRGMERYDIYCSVCHDKSGQGKGSVIERGMVPPPNLSEARIVALNDGEIFNIITNGIRNMPDYKKQIPVEDRWAIVTYVRALQKSRSTHMSEIQDRVRGKIQ